MQTLIVTNASLCTTSPVFFVNFSFCFFLLDEAKTTYSLDDVTTMLALMPLMSLWTLFMNVFVLVEWVCRLSENGECCVELFAAGPGYSRVVFMTVPKGGASQSLHASFCIYTSLEMYLNYGMFFFIWLYWLALTGGRPQWWHHLLLIPSFTASNRSSNSCHWQLAAEVHSSSTTWKESFFPHLFSL